MKKITISEETKIPGTDYVLEVGDIISIREAAKYFGSFEGMSYAVKIDGIPNDYYSLPFGRKIDYRNKIKEFKADAKSTYVGAKGESTMKAVKKWVKEMGVSQFYASWKSDSRMHSDDSVEIFYKE